jgi:hypothetical protein
MAAATMPRRRIARTGGRSARPSWSSRLSVARTSTTRRCGGDKLEIWFAEMPGTQFQIVHATAAVRQRDRGASAQRHRAREPGPECDGRRARYLLRLESHRHLYGPSRVARVALGLVWTGFDSDRARDGTRRFGRDHARWLGVICRRRYGCRHSLSAHHRRLVRAWYTGRSCCTDDVADDLGSALYVRGNCGGRTR